VRFENVCAKSGYTLPLKIRPPKPRLLRFRDLPANLTAYIFEVKHDTHNRSTALTTMWSIHRPKMSCTLVNKQLQTRPPFYPPYVYSAFYFIARLRRRRSANRTQPNYAKRWTVNRANNLLQQSPGRPSLQKWSKNFDTCSIFRRLGDLTENLRNETRHNNRQSDKGIVKYKRSPTSSQKFLNFGPHTA